MLITTNNIMTLGYAYANLRLKKTPGICANMHTPSGYLHGFLKCYPVLRHYERGTEPYYIPYPPTAFTGTNNQEGPTNFDTSTKYMIW